MITKEQEKAINSNSRHVSIIACAGSGKTRTLVARVARLINQKIAPSSETAVITFTVKAAEELRERISSSVNRPDAAADLFCGTIHSYCYHLLTRHLPQSYCNLGVFSDIHQLVLLSKMRYVWDVDKIDPPLFSKSKGRFFKALAESMNIIKLESLDSDEKLRRKYPLVFKTFDDYEAYLRSNDLADFIDLIRLTLKHFNADSDFCEKVRRRSRWLFVDEYQDVDPLQHELIKSITSSGNLCVVGDDDQSIYQFRGTDPKHFMKLCRKRKDREVVRLDTNFRCREHIVQNAKRVITKCNTRLQKPMKPDKTNGEVFKYEFENIKSEAEFVCREIEHLRTERFIDTYSDVAILLRSVASHGIHYIEELRKSGIPIATRGDKGLFNDPVVQSIRSALEFIAHPDDTIEAISPLAYAFQVDLTDLAKRALEYTDLSDQDFLSVGVDKASILRFRTWEQIRTKYRQRRFSCLLEIVLDVVSTFSMLDKNESINACYNLGEFTQIVAVFDEIAQTKNLLELCGFLNMFAKSLADEAEAPDSFDAVDVMTVHQAKGLQYSVVFLPNLCENRFPLSQKSKELMLDLEDFDSARYVGRLDDERRLFYVASTRPADKLYLSYAKNVGGKGKKAPSIFFNECIQHIASKRAKEARSVQRETGNIPLSLSYSAAELYLSCPFRYQLANMIGIATPPNPFFEYGRIIHHVVRRMHELHSTTGSFEERQIEKLYEDNFRVHMQVPSFTIHRWKSSGLKAIKQYYLKRREWFDAMHAVEHPFAIATEGVLLSGQYDLLVRDAESYIIVDLKTGKPHDYINTEFQVMLYGMVAHEFLGLKTSKAYVHYIEHDEAVEYRPSHADFQSAKKHFLDVAVRIKANDFAPLPGDVCIRCEYKGICPHAEGRR